MPYGRDVKPTGKRLWGVFRGEQLIAIAATKREARTEELRALGYYGRPPATLPSELEGRQDLPHKLRPGEKLGPE